MSKVNSVILNIPKEINNKIKPVSVKAIDF